ncbi:MAG: hypothetical protein R6X27_10055 [Candidatus Desulfacyla sp.]
MMESRKACRITAFLPRSFSKDVLTALNDVGVHDICMAAARSLVIKAKKGLSLLLPGRDLIADPMDLIFFLGGEAMETSLFNLVVEKGHLAIPGMGSVISEEIEVLSGDLLYNEGSVQSFDANTIPVHPYAVTGICCIVQRGRGEDIARIALDTGTCVPSISFGIGTGVRDKMGLLRIAIPAEKEIIHVFSSVYEAGGILTMMADAGDLEQPGKGFIYSYPVKKAVVNTKVIRGGQQYVASIEQVVTAIDHMKGGAEWRRRVRGIERPGGRKRSALSRLIEINLLCDGGTGPDLVKAAMTVGAGGSTTQSFRHVRPSDSPLNAMSPMRELCSIIVAEEAIETIADALQKAGAFTDRCHGQIHFRRVPSAVTYRSK